MPFIFWTQKLEMFISWFVSRCGTLQPHFHGLQLKPVMESTSGQALCCDLCMLSL